MFFAPPEVFDSTFPDALLKNKRPVGKAIWIDFLDRNKECIQNDYPINNEQ